MSTWTKQKLGDILDTLIDYRGKTPKKCTSGIPLITAKIVKNGFITEPKEFIAEGDYTSWMKRGFPQIGDLVLTTEAPLGEVATIKNSKIALAQRTVVLRGKSEVLNTDYLKNFLKSPVGQQRLIARGTGTTVLGIKQSELRKVEVDLPDIKTQTCIASVLSAYDDLIENNEKRIKILEEMAERLYREWFVKFKFPGHEKTRLIDSGTEYGKIPEGWGVKTLGMLLENLHISTRRGEHLSDRKYLPIECISKKSFVLRQTNDWKEAQSSLILFEKNDLLFGAMRPYFHKAAISPFSGVTRSTCLVLRPRNKSYRSFALLTIFSDMFVSFASSNTQGATIPYAAWNNSLENYKVVAPDNKTLEDFEDKMMPIIDQLNCLSSQNKILSKIRDLLIPLLVTEKREVKK